MRDILNSCDNKPSQLTTDQKKKLDLLLKFPSCETSSQPKRAKIFNNRIHALTNANMYPWKINEDLEETTIKITPYHEIIMILNQEGVYESGFEINEYLNLIIKQKIPIIELLAEYNIVSPKWVQINIIKSYHKHIFEKNQHKKVYTLFRCLWCVFLNDKFTYALHKIQPDLSKITLKSYIENTQIRDMVNSCIFLYLKHKMIDTKDLTKLTLLIMKHDPLFKRGIKGNIKKYRPQEHKILSEHTFNFFPTKEKKIIKSIICYHYPKFYEILCLYKNFVNFHNWFDNYKFKISQILVGKIVNIKFLNKESHSFLAQITKIFKKTIHVIPYKKQTKIILKYYGSFISAKNVDIYKVSSGSQYLDLTPEDKCFMEHCPDMEYYTDNIHSLKINISSAIPAAILEDQDKPYIKSWVKYLQKHGYKYDVEEKINKINTGDMLHKIGLFARSLDRHVPDNPVAKKHGMKSINITTISIRYSYQKLIKKFLVKIFKHVLGEERFTQDCLDIICKIAFCYLIP